MALFFKILVFWAFVVFGAKAARRWWRWKRFCQPASCLSEIRDPKYYRSLSAAQFEFLVMRALKAYQFTLLGDPYLGRPKKQGYAWKQGKKVVLVPRLDKPLTAGDLEEISKLQRKARAQQALVFSPFSEAPGTHQPDLEVLAGKKLLQWFSVLNLAPPVTVKAGRQKCDCGEAMNARVNRAGQPLLVCSRYPSCQSMRKPEVRPHLSLDLKAIRPIVALTAC